MNYLLDTHSFLWFLFSPHRLSRTAAEIILHQENTIYVSSITFWEISLKYSLNKIQLERVTPEQLPNFAQEAGMELLDFRADEAASFCQLPKTAHNDPFDRMLIWLAMRHHLTIISKDRHFKDYVSQGLKITW